MIESALIFSKSIQVQVDVNMINEGVKERNLKCFFSLE